MSKRHSLYNKLFPKLTDSCGWRVRAQLTYLEELNKAKNAGFEPLLEEAAVLTAKLYQQNGNLTNETVAKIEKVLEPASKLAKATTVSCVGHAHIDMNWMWRYDETASLAIDTLRTMLQLMREYPNFTFAQSQASVYKIVEDYAPEMLLEIKERICEGRWEVTASQWVETDKNMPSGESLTRHLLYTRQYLKNLLSLSDEDFLIDFEPDTFGHGSNVPEILASGGVKYMYHCRGYNQHHIYRWQAPSGAQITVFRDPTWYNDAIGPETFCYVPAFCAKNNIDRVLHVYGVGNHGGGATRRDIERIMQYNTWPCMPTITFGRYTDFFRYLGTKELPVVDRELNFVFDGCYTSQSRIKKANRVSEAVLGEAEFLNTASYLCDAYGYDAGKFADYWKNTLFNHFHDILPGSGTIDTREHALGLFQQTMAGAGTRLSAAARGIASKINTALLLPVTEISSDSTAEGGGGGFNIGQGIGTSGYAYTTSNPVGGAKRLFVLFNPSQAVINTASFLTVWDWEGDMNKLRFTNEAGNILEHQLIDNHQIHYWGHNYFRVHVKCEIPAFGYNTVLMEEADTCDKAWTSDFERVEGPESYVLENDYVKAEFDPVSAALISFICKKTGQEYVGKTGGQFRYIEEDPSRGMTSWRVGRFAKIVPVAENLKMSHVSGSLVRQFSYEAPVPDTSSKLNITVSLDKNAHYLKYSVTCDWREFGIPGVKIPALGFNLPLNYECKQFTYDNAFGVVSRDAVNNDVPAHSFAFAPMSTGRNDGLMLSSDSKYGFRGFNNELNVNLIRSSYDPDPIPEIYTHSFTLNVGIVPDASPSALLNATLEQNRAAIAVACAPQQGELPLSGSMLTVIEGDIVISSVKIAESGDAVIVRGYDVTGKNGEATLLFQKAVRSAAYVDAHENELAQIVPTIGENTVKVNFCAYGVVAVKLLF